MAKTLIYADGSPTSVKISDTDTNLYLQLAKDGTAVDLSTAKSIDVKIADNNKNYLKDISINPADLLNASKGVLILPLNSTNIAGLPAGSYAFEVWIETADSNQEIYPDIDVKMFTIFSNIVGGTTVIAQLTLQQFANKITDMEADLQSKVNSGYFKGDKGDKGDTGTVDNAGLTNAPAFQALQTQVNNSAVGTNLLTGTSMYASGWSWDVTPTIDTSQTPAILHYPITTISSGKIVIAQDNIGTVLQPSTTYTASFYAKGTGTFIFYCCPSVSSTVSATNGTAIPRATDCHTSITLTDSYTQYAITFTTLSTLSGSKNFILRRDYDSNNPSTATVEAYIYGMKLEKGSVATDWCPNPTEILTQSDYAKIKAAIVALGGSLS